jgi:solute carrier family 25 carnitine/acylcarnitine transporter 20/29
VGVAYPFDTIKSRTQAFLDDAPPGSKAPPAWEIAMQVLAEEGPVGFFSGVTSTMVGQAINKGLVFGTFEEAKKFLQVAGGVDVLGPGPLFLAACFSAGPAALLVTPIERIKCVMQADVKHTFGSPLECLAAVVAEDGVGGLMTRGLGVTLLREVPSYGIYFLAYAQTKTALLAALASPPCLALSAAAGISDPAGLAASVAPFVGGAAAGVASWIPVYPADVVKVRQSSVRVTSLEPRSFYPTPSSDCFHI